jgi:hypothetical protein
MPLNRGEWLGRIKAVEQQYAAVQLAVLRLRGEGRDDPTILTGDIQHRHIVAAERELEGTYIIRLFAEFETGLRIFWATERESHPPTRDLLNGIAAMRNVPDALREHVHAVREYRNSLVHEREDEEVEPIPIAVARSYLCRFFSLLPPQW